ncbi:unnamed protein product [marine sediment metagenome]|uniref:Uncharacterized protein n=1 Tax=marine sediment metagenome TaxID=412755 RepID=X0Z3J3_9ZZZZ
MKTKIISSSDFIKASAEGCCSPTRFFNHCEDCDKVMKCKHPEARKGKVKILDGKIAEAKKKIEEWEEEKNDHKL